MYLLKRIDVWSRNRLSRVVKTPKLQFIDSGLLSTLLDLTTGEIQQNKIRFGNVLETFVYGNRFKTGLLLYDGTETMPLGENIWAAPLSSLWGK